MGNHLHSMTELQCMRVLRLRPPLWVGTPKWESPQGKAIAALVSC